MLSGISYLGVPGSVIFTAPPPCRDPHDLGDSDCPPVSSGSWNNEIVYVLRLGVRPVPSSELKGEQ